MNAKIRDAQRQKTPYMLVIGDREVENEQVALRLRSGDKPDAMSVSDLTNRSLVWYYAFRWLPASVVLVKCLRGE